MNLVIVESPTKARKLAGFLGKDFKIEASVGHIRDLPKKELGVDVDNNFKPTYKISTGKSKIVANLRLVAKNAKEIYLATDPDREGEAIAWHIKHLLEHQKGKAKLKADFHRASFHEITKTAVLKAMEKPAKINMDLVDAQQARRVMDRLVGYKISPVLWKKIRRGLSAGRVQSVALRLIVDREREIEAFSPDEYWEVYVALSVKGKKIKLEAFDSEGKVLEELDENAFIAQAVSLNGKKYSPTKEADVAELGKVLPSADYVISQIEKKNRNRVSLPPFTTSTLQQRAATQFGYSGKQTMRLAQQLYEEGLITYHRTDSVNISQSAVEMARDYIKTEFGSSYLPDQPRYFAQKSKTAQEAHEAIRVTSINVSANDLSQKGAKFGPQHHKLYDLIWRRFVASQMERAVYDQTSVTIDFNPTIKSSVEKGELKATGSILKFDGWMKLFPNREDSLLPDLNENQELDFVDQFLAQKFTQPPARYNDASLIKELEKRGIGRPSTYASIISVIIDRGYVERQEKKFFATSIGITVGDFLFKHFPHVMDYEFTAEMEDDLDKIALGEKKWQKVVGDFFTPLAERIDKVVEKAERAQIPVEKTGEICPDCGQTEKGEVVIRTGRFGKFKSCSRFPECKFTENIVETVSDVVCPLCQKGEVVVKNTRWGKSFFGCGNYPECKWASWKKPEKGETISQAEFDEIQKKRAEKKKKWLASKESNKIADKKTTDKKTVTKRSKKKASTKRK